jgi:glyoxylase-like metal-dependent hydrolase (beta-lactamase superfamily II)
MEVAPGIHRIEAPLGDRINCLYLLAGEDDAMLVDTGLDNTPHDSLLPYLESVKLEPQQIRYVVNTHSDFDHMGGNGSLRKLAPTAIFMCHELDRPMIEKLDRMIDRRYGEFQKDHDIDESPQTKDWIRANAHDVPIDLGLTGGEVFHLGAGWHVEVLHTPGHSWGSVSVYDPRSRAAIIGDAVLWNTLLTKDGKPAFPPTYRYVETYVASIQRMQGMPIDLLLTSHYPVYRGFEVADFLGESRAYVDRIDAALRTELQGARSPRTMKDLIESAGPRVGSWTGEPRMALVYPFLGHLERLAAFGLIEADRSNGRVAWRWKA